MELRHTGTWQDDAVTQKRVEEGATLLAFSGQLVVGTITFLNPAPTQDCKWYARPEVASFHQFAVAPELQGAGIGSDLLRQAEHMAAASWPREIALETSEQALHLIAMYEAKVYRPVGFAWWHDTNYRRIILSKTPALPTPDLPKLPSMVD